MYAPFSLQRQQKQNGASVPGTGVGKDLGVQPLWQEQCVHQNWATRVRRTSEAREGVLVPAPRVRTSYKPVCLVPGAGGRRNHMHLPQSYCAEGVHVQFSSKLQGGLPSEYEASCRGRGIKWADSPCWHLRETTRAESMWDKCASADTCLLLSIRLH